MSVRIHFVDGVEAGGGRSSNVEVAGVVEGEMISCDAGLFGREDLNLAVPAVLEDRSAAVANVEAAILVEGDAGRDTHPFGVRSHGAVA